jgi:predicted DNA-binding transcriptional regulator YafY
MPINKLALVRYKTIDNCLQNRFRKWTLEDLMEACSDALYEYEGISKGVSRRTIQLDLQNMRSEKLGYNAPIIVVDRKFYAYEDKNYSITNIPLTSQDMGTLNEVVEILKQFKGFNYFEELTGMITRLEDKVYKHAHKGRSYIDFEKNDLLKGLEYIEPLHKATVNRKTLKIYYQSFKAKEASELIFYPYLLKEYRNRWFLLGATKKGKSVLILALDRIAEVQNATGEKYANPDFDVFTYFDNAIGVSKMPNQVEQKVVLKINNLNAPYVLTKPLHPSQKILKQDNNGMIFSIDVIWNFELEREILGFGEAVTVLSPARLRRSIISRLKKGQANYEEAPSLVAGSN